MLAKLVRYFGQTPDYWLDTCTLRDWDDIYGRELRQSPPADDWAAAYFKHQPEPDADDAVEGEIEEWVNPYPETTE